MADPLKLVPMEEDDETSVLNRVKRVDELVDELIAANEALIEEMEKIRLALGMDRYDFDKFRRDGFIAQAQSDVVGQAIEGLVGKLEKVLGHE